MNEIPIIHCANEEVCNRTCFVALNVADNPPHHFEVYGDHYLLVMKSMEECRKRIDHILNHQHGKISTSN